MYYYEMDREEFQLPIQEEEAEGDTPSSPLDVSNIGVVVFDLDG